MIPTIGLAITEHSFEAPLDHSREAGERITVFAREIAYPNGRDRPFLVYFQGGPGFEAARPTRNPDSPGWLDRALQDFRVLMLDQRGTGRSSPVGALPGLNPRSRPTIWRTFARTRSWPTRACPRAQPPVLQSLSGRP